eukprot:CAMPEP_0172445436 /NCGR_PEP_ID=MMETSP1065-20121228/5261_1 /TAXON_ID=265537 /ORGANISM="Amphiprora paludosa, Strain CCMP125" /LENGTH=211 /DNA_ID=CAMNT_0013196269 /DNA_START=224 /DNA_END=856 /DNA_ORIENTATION=-
MNDIADAFLEVADALQIGECVVLGCLMGNFTAVSLASRYPDRIKGCICANLYYFPRQVNSKQPETTSSNNKEEGQPIPDSWQLQDDGSHLSNLHNRRKAWLDNELNARVVQSELTYLVNRRARYAQGISIENFDQFDFVAAATQVQCPTLCIKGVACCAFFDQIGQAGTARYEQACQWLSSSCSVDIDGPKSTINMINQAPQEVAQVVNQF